MQSLVKQVSKGKITIRTYSDERIKTKHEQDSDFLISEERERELLEAIQKALHSKDITRYELMYILQRLQKINEFAWLTIGEIQINDTDTD